MVAGEHAASPSWRKHSLAQCIQGVVIAVSRTGWLAGENVAITRPFVTNIRIA